MLILDEKTIEKTNKEVLFLEDAKNPEKFDFPVTEYGGRPYGEYAQIKEVWNDSNLIQEVIKDVNRRFYSSFFDKDIKFSFYYNVYKRMFVTKPVYGETAIKVEINGLDLKKHNENTLPEAISEYVIEHSSEILSRFYSDILSIDENFYWRGDFLPEDLGIEKTIECYVSLRDLGIVKESEFWFSDNDIKRIGTYAYNELKKATEFPQELTRILKFIPKTDKAEILIKSLFEPLTEAVEAKEIGYEDYITARARYLAVSMDKLKVFSNASVKKAYKAFVLALKEDKNPELSNLLLKLDSGDFNKTIKPLNLLSKEDNYSLVIEQFTAPEIVENNERSRFAHIEPYYYENTNKIIFNRTSGLINSITKAVFHKFSDDNHATPDFVMIKRMRMSGFEDKIGLVTEDYNDIKALFEILERTSVGEQIIAENCKEVKEYFEENFEPVELKLNKTVDPINCLQIVYID